MIEIKNLTKKYPNNKENTLNQISITFPDAGLVYLIGKSGSGKSTLLNILGAIDEDYSGEVIVDGIDLKTFTEKEKADYRFEKISFVFQSYKAEDKETVKMNLEKILAIEKCSKEEKKRIILSILKEVGLSDKLNENYENLSGGEKKRISLARGLIKQSSILLADEPLSSLNGTMRKEITKLLRKASQQKLVIVITHEKEEIPDDAFVYELINGKLTTVKEGKTYSSRVSNHPIRKPFKGKESLKQMLSMMNSEKEFLLFAVFALIIALFSISFSFQLSNGVSDALISSFSDYMQDNSLVVSSKDEGFLSTEFETPELDELNEIKESLGDIVDKVENFYLDDFNSIYNDNQSVSLSYANRSLLMKKLSLNSFLNPKSFDETKNETIYGRLPQTKDEVVLATDSNAIQGLGNLLCLNEENDKEQLKKSIGKQLTRSQTNLSIKCRDEIRGEQKSFSYHLVGIVESNQTYLINDEEDFTTHFVEDNMGFASRNENEAAQDDIPSLRKCSGFRIRTDQVNLFLNRFLETEVCDPYVCKTLQDDNYSEDISTHNHIAVYVDCMPKISLSDIREFTERHSSEISSVAYSSSVYTYTASGYISGFAKPTFFSKYKEKLNLTEDNSYECDVNLGAMQGSLIDDVEGVIKADLSSSMDNDGLKFKSLYQNNFIPIYGVAPSDCSQIGISTSMSDELFGSKSNALGQTLCILSLDRTEYQEDHYINHFSQGEVQICGIYEDDSISIYQDSLFPLAYSFTHCSLSLSENRISQVVMNVDLEKHDTSYYLEELRKGGKYSGDFPMETMIEEINETLNQLSLIFFSFSILSLISAAILLSLCMYLILQKNRKEIGIMLSFGYRKNEIVRFYSRFIFLIAELSYFGSLILSLITQSALQDTLGSMLSSYQTNLLPFLLSEGCALSLTILISFIFRLWLRKLSPKDAFKKS